MGIRNWLHPKTRVSLHHPFHLVSRVPLVGPVRLRTHQVNPEDLAVMKRGFEIALSAFGLEEWSADE
uniref:hypothetical protein n=1 Tax=Vaginimicrobium propionicum TaxID=1871034 RepID=UPI0012EC42E2|nr:hypothetical protein [Vaginimicrobium propionicum]